MALVDYGYDSDEDEVEPVNSTPGLSSRAPGPTPSQVNRVANPTIQSRESPLNRTQTGNSQQASSSRAGNRQGQPDQLPRPGTSALPSAASLFEPAATPSGLPSPDSLFGRSWGGNGASNLEAGVARRASTGGARPGLAGEARKRAEPSGNSHLAPFQKVPRGGLPPQRVPPDTNRGQLIPPQLQGRRNVATEDLDKLFVRKAKRPMDPPP